MMIRQSTREVEDNDAESSCRGIANTTCIRCTTAINTRYREEMGVVVVVVRVVVFVDVESDSCMKKEDGAAAELI
jgi:hypothetical protein